jgi:hypothetical protein
MLAPPQAEICGQHHSPLMQRSEPIEDPPVQIIAVTG